MQTVAETQTFNARVKALRIPKAEVDDIFDQVAANPENAVSLGGGLYKRRVKRQGTGKSGGYRIIYFYKYEDIPIQMLTIFAKNQKDNISDAERKALIELGAVLVECYRRSK